MKSKKILLIQPSNIKEKIPFKFKKIHSNYYNSLINYEKKILKDKGIFIKEPEINYNALSRGLLCIATFLKENGFNPIYLSMAIERKKYNCLNWREKILKKWVKGVDIVGITSYTSNFNKALAIAKTLKKIKPNLIIALGGAHANALGKEIIKNKCFDIIVLGEGELTFLNLCKKLINNESLDKVSGIIYKNNKKIIQNSFTPLLKGYDIPVPAYYLLPQNYNFQYILETTRGCPYSCSFCVETSFWKKVRFRDPKKIIEELKHIISLGFNTIHICDPIFTLNQEHIKKIIYEIKKNEIKMNFSCEARLELLNPEMISLLKELGVYKIFVGIESGSDKILKNMNKGVNFEIYYNTLKNIKGKIPYIDTSWLFGFPGETRETIEESTQKMEKLFKEGLINGIWPKILVPYPGTPLFSCPQEYDLKISSKNWNKYNRNGYPPVYKLKTLKKKEIYKGFMYFLQKAYFLYNK